MDKDMLIRMLGEVLEQEPSNIDLSKSFVDNGGYSLAATKLIEAIHPVTGTVLNFFEVMGDEPLQALLEERAHDELTDEDSEMEEGVL